MRIEDPRRLLIGLGGLLAMLLWTVWVVATHPHP